MKPLLVLSLLTATVALSADFPALYNSDPGNPQPTPPQEALRMLKVPLGFKATLFAAEPDVQNPVGMAWDTKGRMWVAENYTYAERAKRFDLGLKDRVIVLEDKDWDGVAETRKVFTQDVQMLTSVEVGRGGVWLMCPPQVLFIPDANGDDVPDGEPQVVLDGFTVAKDNYHNFANGLRFGPDGWLYGRCGHSCPGSLGVPGTPEEQRVPMKGGIWRFHPEKKIVEVLTHGTTNPWGHDWDANGEMFFINTVTGHLWHLIHGAHLMDSSTANPFVYEKLDTIADHYHYDRSGSWTASRDGKANSLGGGHAHIGMMIYQADQWPEMFRNKLFTLNMHGRRANVERLERRGSSYVGRHEPDVFLSDDPWFRGIEISTGPDGSGFILDWSDTGECHESTGVHRTSGRIFRISHGTPTKQEKPFAWRKPLPQADLHAENEYQRVRAIRELTQFWPLDTLKGPLQGVQYPQADPATLAAFLQMGREDPSSLVQLTLASTLQRLPVEKRLPLALALMPRIDQDESRSLEHLLWYGVSPLATTDPAALLEVARLSKGGLLIEWITRALATNLEKQPEPLNALLLLSLERGFSQDVLTGLSKGLAGWRKAPKPAAWEQFAAKVQSSASSSSSSAPSPALSNTVTQLGQIFGDGLPVEALRHIIMDAAAEMPARIAALKTLIEARPPELRAICEAALDTRELDVTAIGGLALFDDPAIAQQLLKRRKSLSPAARITVIDTLVARPAFAKELLKEMAAGKIPRADLSAFHARQIRAFNDEGLTKTLVDVWGELRESAADKKALIEKVKGQLTPEALAKANLSQGRMLFSAVCGACHVMYGEGGKIGPDLTGSGRANLDYLLENIADPSGVVSADFRMSVLTLKDGRVLSGVIGASTDRTVTLRTLAESTTLDKAEIVKTETSPMSMMPEGLLLALQPDQVRDIIAYLMHPSQVALPKGP